MRWESAFWRGASCPPSRRKARPSNAASLVLRPSGAMEGRAPSLQRRYDARPQGLAASIRDLLWSTKDLLPNRSPIKSRSLSGGRAGRPLGRQNTRSGSVRYGGASVGEVSGMELNHTPSREAWPFYHPLVGESHTAGASPERASGGQRSPRTLAKCSVRSPTCVAISENLGSCAASEAICSRTVATR